jgi:3-hydroxyisobutyrate dehydrogenase-like beta-hydroxyacid dehydrogenase
VMGSGIAKRLLIAGHTVYGYNRTREKAAGLVELGLILVDSPREVAERATVVFSMVTDTKAVTAVTRGSDGILAGLAPGKVYIDMTTASPENSRALAAEVEALGARMLDAPVSGSVLTIEQGKLVIMVGGSRETFAEVEPILLDIGPVVRWIGVNGQAVLLKIAMNVNVAIQMVAFSEGLLIAEKGGIDKEVAVDAMLNSVIASPMLKYRAPFVIEQPEEAWFDCNLMQKDLNLALEAGRQLDVPLPTTAIANELMTAARGLSLDKRDFAIVYEVLGRLAGMPKAAV